MPSLLIIEDDLRLNQALCLFFRDAGYQTESAADLQTAKKLAASVSFDLILSDLILPDGTGFAFAKWFGEEKCPIIFLTAKDEEEDILEGYDVGCIDYIVKPINPEILKRKIQAILERTSVDLAIIRYQDLSVDLEKKKAFIQNKEIKLTAKEYKLLAVLVQNRGKILTKETLLRKVWDIDGNFVGENTVSVTINRLRKKINDNPADPCYIKNIFGLGYTFGD
ncbi:response regulator transcription factor [Enterococcus massiliensis]|uniref:response regulator transcription factor n=1 Tax=Enterococcus massiliensis TaxID=1640685 RepID=UPI00065E108A|nr:response regulator transcription factor [Enterococcus massiliensis]